MLPLQESHLALIGETRDRDAGSLVVTTPSSHVASLKACLILGRREQFFECQLVIPDIGKTDAIRFLDHRCKSLKR